MPNNILAGNVFFFFFLQKNVNISYEFTKFVCFADHSNKGQNLFSLKNEKKKNIQSTLCYLEFQGTLWNTLRYSYLDVSDLQNRGKNNLNNHI